MKSFVLGDRLAFVASLVREGATLYDVGTDHAYIPVALMREHAIKEAYACDVADGPLRKAEENIRASGIESGIRLVKTDGLSGLEPDAESDVVIAGMGGDLIARILDASDAVKKNAPRLILQPMSKPERLSKYLCENGFRISDDYLVRDDRIYRVLVCVYTGEKYELGDIEMLLGRGNIERGDELFLEYSGRIANVLRGRIEGKKLAGADFSREDKIVKEIEALRASIDK